MITKVEKGLSYVTATTLLLLVSIVLYDAIVRYFFSSGSIALQELEWHLFDVVILFSIAYALREDSHVRVDIFYEKFSKKTQALIDLVSLLFFVLPFAALIIYIGIDFVTMSFLQNEESSNPGGLTHRWIVKSLMPLSFFFVVLIALRKSYSAFKIWRAM